MMDEKSCCDRVVAQPARARMDIRAKRKARCENTLSITPPCLNNWLHCVDCNDSMFIDSPTPKLSQANLARHIVTVITHSDRRQTLQPCCLHKPVGNAHHRA